MLTMVARACALSHEGVKPFERSWRQHVALWEWGKCPVKRAYAMGFAGVEAWIGISGRTKVAHGNGKRVREFWAALDVSGMDLDVKEAEWDRSLFEWEESEDLKSGNESLNTCQDEVRTPCKPEESQKCPIKRESGKSGSEPPRRSSDKWTRWPMRWLSGLIGRRAVASTGVPVSSAAVIRVKFYGEEVEQRFQRLGRNGNPVLAFDIDVGMEWLVTATHEFEGVETVASVGQCFKFVKSDGVWWLAGRSRRVKGVFEEAWESLSHPVFGIRDNVERFLCSEHSAAEDRYYADRDSLASDFCTHTGLRTSVSDEQRAASRQAMDDAFLAMEDFGAESLRLERAAKAAPEAIAA